MLRILAYCGGFAQTNGYLVFSPEGEAVVIDAPEGMGDWLEEAAVTPDVLLLTHAHFDHVVDAARIQERFSCPIRSHSDPHPDLTLETWYGEQGLRVEPYRVDERVAADSRITVGGLAFTCLHVPGHSPDSLCFVPEPAGERDIPVVFGGDVLFRGSIGRTDFPNGDHEALLRGIRAKLFALPDRTVVYPGHGPATTIGEEKDGNPYLQ